MSFSRSSALTKAVLLLGFTIAGGWFLPVPGLAQQAVNPSQEAHRRKAKVAKKTAPEPPPVPAPPPPPPTLEQMPASAPQVHYSKGQLTITAQNSTLADILRAVRSQTGATVEVPPNANERVVGHFGPGPARDVLAALLNGAHFNYVMIGSPAHPDSVERLILTSKAGAAPEPAPSTAAAQPNNNEAPADDASAAPEPEPTTEEQPETSANGDGPSPAPDREQQQQVKTPEQLLRELQQQQLLQQQLQQQQAQPPSGPPPN